MPGERLSMRKIRDVLRLRFGQGLSQRAIGSGLGLSIGAINSYLSRARLAGLGWPLPEGLGDEQLEALLYPPPPLIETERRPTPDWAMVHRELRRPNVTLSLLWEEYRTGPGAQDGFSYSWFCDLYREWAGRLKPTLRQVHTAGDRVFVDFAGRSMEVIEGATGEIRRAEIFVAVLGASSYIFAEATWTQSLPDWIAAHVAMLTFIGGVPGQIVSDNLRAGITRACFYEPLVNRTYADMAAHYGTAVIPARPYKPHDDRPQPAADVVSGARICRRRIRRLATSRVSTRAKRLVRKRDRRPGMTTDPAHLTAAAAQSLSESNANRMRAVLAERWVHYPRAGHVLQILNRLLAHPRSTRMPSIAIYGDSGMGKTMIMEKFRREHPPLFDGEAGVERTRVLALQMAGKPGERRLYAQILTALGAPQNPRAAVVDLEQVALRLMRAVDVQVLVLDEVHNILAGTFRGQRIVLNTLRYLSNELKISLVCFGVNEAREAISGDVQLARRFEEFPLPRWSAEEGFEQLVLAIIRNLPLRQPTVLSARAVRKMLQVTDGITAKVFRMLNDLAIEAIETGAERITDEAIERWRPMISHEMAFA